MSNYTRVAWNPKERVARAASYLDDYFGRHQYGCDLMGMGRSIAPMRLRSRSIWCLFRKLKPNPD